MILYFEHISKMLNKKVYITLIVFAIFLSGCSSNQKKYLQQLPDVPENWSTLYSGDSNSRGWINEFNDKTLFGLVREALENNKDLGVAFENVKIARARARASLAPLLPSISIGAAKSQISSTIKNSNNDIERVYNYRESLLTQLNWEIDIWGRLSTRSRASYLNAKAIYNDYDAAKLSIVGLTAQAWYLFCESKLQADLAQRNLDTRLRTLERVENRYQKGIVQSRDLRLARSEVESRRADLLNRNKALSEAARNLEIIIGRYPSSSISAANLPILPPKPLLGSPENVLKNRPDIKSSEIQLEQAGLEVTAARLAFLPSLNITAQWSTSEKDWSDAFDPDRLAGNIIANLTQSIFQGGTRIAQSKITESQMKIILNQYSKTLLNAAREIEDAVFAENILQEREKALSNAFKEAKAAEELTLDQYNKGVSTIFELLDAQSRRLNAESLLINSSLLRITNRIKLHLAISSPLFEEI